MGLRRCSSPWGQTAAAKRINGSASSPLTSPRAPINGAQWQSERRDRAVISCCIPHANAEESFAICKGELRLSRFTQRLVEHNEGPHIIVWPLLSGNGWWLLLFTLVPRLCLSQGISRAWSSASQMTVGHVRISLRTVLEGSEAWTVAHA